MRDKIGKLTEDTLIPISLVVILIGGVAWLSNLHAESAANAAAIMEIKTKQDDYNKTLQEISQHLSRIEGKLDIHTQ